MVKRLVVAVVLALLGATFLGTFLVPGPCDDLGAGTAAPSSSSVGTTDPTIPPALGAAAFIENIGQLPDGRIRFYAEGDPLSVGITDDGAVFTLRAPRVAPEDETVDVVSFRMRLVGCDPSEPYGVGRLGYPSHFYLGADPGRWVRGASSFEGVRLDGVREGVDLVFQLEDGRLKYSLEVAPGSGRGDIVLQYEGVDGLAVDPASGDLLIATALGTLRDARPTVQQRTASGADVDVPGEFRPLGGDRVTFALPPRIDPDEGFVIDPGMVFSTYLGGVGDDFFESMARDSEGNIHLVGTTNSVAFPEESGYYHASLERDVFGFILPKGSGRPSASYRIGGESLDCPSGIKVLGDGTIWVVGYTYSSTSFPLKDPMAGYGGGCDAFLLRLAGNATDLLFSSYFGGMADENPVCCDVDGDGSLYMAGLTKSADLDFSSGAWCSTIKNPADGAQFIAKFSLSPVERAYCTLLDGLPNEFINAISVDANGSAFLVGRTKSTREDGFPVTPGAFDGTPSSGGSAFAVRLAPNGSSIERGTYLGGMSAQVAYDCELTPDGSIATCGYTTSLNFPTTPNAYSDSMRGDADAFLTVLDHNLTSLVYSTYYGTDGTDFGHGLSVSSDGRSIALLGETASGTLPLTSGTFDGIQRGRTDLFLACFDLASGALAYSTYIGGSGDDMACFNCIVWNGTRSVVIAGSTTSVDFPVVGDAFCATYAGGATDVFLLEIEPVPCSEGPLPPPGLNATAGEGFVRLSWRQPPIHQSRVLRYNVYRMEEGVDVEPTLYATVDGSNLSWADDNVTNGHRYTYEVSASNWLFEGPRSGSVHARPIGKPSEPAHVGWKTGDGAIEIVWSSPLFDGGDLRGYQVLKGPAADYVTQQIADVPFTTGSFRDQNVTTGSTYFYAVRAYNIVGIGPFGAVVRAVPLGPPSGTTSFGFDEGDECIKLTWKAPDDDGGNPVTGYDLFFKKDGGAWQSLVNDTTELTYTQFPTENGHEYYYYIVAGNPNGTSVPVYTQSPAVSYGVPSEPRRFNVTPLDRIIQLTWIAPANDNGDPVAYYNVSVDMSLSGNWPMRYENIKGLDFTFNDAVNGNRYYFKVVAVNRRGSGRPSEVLTAVSMRIPDPPALVSAVPVENGIKLTWTEPIWDGDPLNYQIQRGTLTGSMSPIGEVVRDLTFIDRQAIVNATYRYTVSALNPQRGTKGPSNEIVVTVTTLPDPVPNLKLDAGDREVLLTWGRPSYDGGSPIVGYIILKGSNETDLVEYLRVDNSTFNHTDDGLVNGRNYSYAVRALNAVGMSRSFWSQVVMPLGSRNAPYLYSIEYRDGMVSIKWTYSPTADTWPATGFNILRGESKEDLRQVASLGAAARMWVDGTAEKGRRYFYAVEATSSRGTGGRSELLPVSTETETGSTFLLALAIIVLLAIAMAVMLRASRRSRALGTPSEPPAPVTVVVEPGSVGSAAPAEGPGHIVEEIFVIYRDGRLIAECSRDACKTADADLMSGMLIAVQGIVQEGLQKGGELESIKYGDSLIVIRSGAYINVAAIVFGEPDEELVEELEASVERIEVSYSGVIEQWNGDLGSLAGMTDMVKPLFERTVSLTRANIRGPAQAPAVSLLSSIDFHSGYVRLKIAVVNATRESVTDASIEVHYDHDMLRLERVVPVTLEVRGDSIILGNVRPDERKSVALLFDPQICQGTHLDGTLVYYDPGGGLRRVEMKRRRADVVCPIFFTKGNANTAMLRRLIKEKLDKSDLRVFNYSEGLTPATVLDIGRRALSGSAVQMVREYIEAGPPYYAEVWYYGETRLKGYQMVMRLGVIERTRSLEFFAASTAMEPVIGLLAEFRRDIERILDERYAGSARLEMRHAEGAASGPSRSRLMEETE